MVKCSHQVFDELCERISGGESLRDICKEPEFPARQNIFKYMDKPGNEAIRDQYVRAKQEQADLLADEIVQIADTEPDAAKARVRVDARKWVASKLKPKTYGDKLQTDNVSSDGSMTPPKTVRLVGPEDK